MEPHRQVRGYTIDVPPKSTFTLADLEWEVKPSAHKSVETLRVLMQQMLLRQEASPPDLMRAWDRSADRQVRGKRGQEREAGSR